MTDSDKLFGGSIPDLYDRYLVPLIFEPYALDIAGRLASAHPQSVLETAAGTGVLTRAMAKVLPQDAHIVATDLNQSMLDHAMTRHSGRGVDWRQADALALPFDDESFDAVACQFGAMFFPDKVHGYKEARRVLTPGGRFIFNVWGPIAENAFADTVTQALAALFPDDPPRFLARTPHGYHDGPRIQGELTEAGFSSVTVEVVDDMSKASSPRHVAIAYCQGTPLRNEIATRDASGLERATEHAANALANRFGTGAIEGGMQALVFTAIR